MLKDFYLIESLDISGLDESQKKILDKQLSLYHEASSIIERASLIVKITTNKKLDDIRFLYNEWLLQYVTKHLNQTIIEEKKQALLNILGNCYNQFGQMYFFKSDYNKALKNYEEVIQIRKEQGNKALLCSSYINVSLVYHRQGDISRALENYEKSAPLLKYIKEKETLGRYYNNIGAIFSQQGNYFRSLDYFYKSIEICEENNLESEAALPTVILVI